MKSKGRFYEEEFLFFALFIIHHVKDIIYFGGAEFVILGRILDINDF